MPRRDITMTPEEVDAFLATHSEVVVVANSLDDAPTGGVGRLHLEAGTVSFTMLAGDPVVELLERDDRVCCIVEQFPTYYEIRGVLLHGRARVARVADADVTYLLEVTETVSFDFSKLPRE